MIHMRSVLKMSPRLTPNIWDGAGEDFYRGTNTVDTTVWDRQSDMGGMDGWRVRGGVHEGRDRWDARVSSSESQHIHQRHSDRQNN